MNHSVFQKWSEALPLAQLTVPFDLTRWTQLVFRVGSHSHGTYVPPEEPTGFDDTDLMVVCTPPPRLKLGIRQWEHATYKHGDLDVVLYDWQKWLRMILKSNPNVVGTLWLEQEDTLVPSGGNPALLYHLLDSRHSLISKQMYQAFVGYAKGQLYKMTHHVHEGYMGEKRTRLVEQFGYDVKNAAHMIRLLRMACEAFETGALTVRRPDAAELIAIKSGQWTLDQVNVEAQRLFNRAASSLASSTIREYPNELVVQDLMLEGYQLAWGSSWRTSGC